VEENFQNLSVLYFLRPLRDHLRPKFEQLVLQGRISLLKKGMNFQRILPTATGKHKGNKPFKLTIN
jgi:hypothetical protein